MSQKLILSLVKIRLGMIQKNTECRPLTFSQTCMCIYIDVHVYINVHTKIIGILLDIKLLKNVKLSSGISATIVCSSVLQPGFQIKSPTISEAELEFMLIQLTHSSLPFVGWKQLILPSHIDDRQP